MKRKIPPIISMVFVWVLLETHGVGASPLNNPKNAKHFIGYSLFLDHHQVRDDLLVPMRFLGIGLRAGIGWAYDGKDVRLGVRAGTGMSYVQERLGNPGAVLPFWLSIDAHKKAFSHWKHITMDLGAFWRSRISHALLFSWDDAHFYYLASHMVGPSAAFRWVINPKAEVSAAVQLPIIGFVGRPPAERFSKQEYPTGKQLFIAPNESLQFSSWVHYRSVGVDLGITWKKRKSRVRIAYVFDYEYTDLPLPTRHLIHSLVLSQYFAIGGRP